MQNGILCVLGGAADMYDGQSVSVALFLVLSLVAFPCFLCIPPLFRQSFNSGPLNPFQIPPLTLKAKLICKYDMRARPDRTAPKFSKKPGCYSVLFHM